MPFWLVKREMDPSKKLKLREFIHNIAFQLLEEFGQPTNTINSRRHAPQPDRITNAINRHFAVPTEMLNGQKRRLDCYVCKNTTRRPSRRMRVTSKCNECNVALCLYSCFKDYHTLKKQKIYVYILYITKMCNMLIICIFCFLYHKSLASVEAGWTPLACYLA